MIKLSTKKIAVFGIMIMILIGVFAGPGIGTIIFVISFFSWSRATRIIYWKAKVAMTNNDIQYALLLKGDLYHIFKKLWKHIYPAIGILINTKIHLEYLSKYVKILML